MQIAREELELLCQSVDVVTVIEGCGVPLTRQGRSLVGLCPFHEDRNPSLVVSPDKGLWSCLGACSSGGSTVGGDSIAFLRRKEGLTFGEAVQRLKALGPGGGNGHHGAPQVCSSPGGLEAASVPGRVATDAAKSNPQERDRADLLAQVAAHYHKTFRMSRQGQEYLKRRGLAEPAMLAAFQAGYSDGSLSKMLDRDAHNLAREIGLLKPGGGEFFQGCVVFPLSLPEIGVVGFYGRHTTRRQHLFLLGPRRGVFHWQAMKGSREVILTESIMDALTLYQAGLRNVTALLGTHGFTDDFSEALRRFRVSRVLLCLDNDEAGTKATGAVAAKLQRLGIDSADARTPGEKDPNGLLAKLGEEAASAAFHEAVELARRYIDESSKPAQDPTKGVSGAASAADGPKPEPEEGGGWQISFPERTYRIRGLSPENLKQLRVNLRVSQGPRMYVETIDLYSHRSRSSWLRQAAGELKHQEEHLSRELNVVIDALDWLRIELKKNPKAATMTIEIPERDREAAMKVLLAPDALERILNDFAEAGFVGEQTALTVGFLASISRLLDDPLSLLVVSRSGAGKTSLQDAICDFIPEESLAKYTRVTGQALFYKDEDSLVHKVLAVEEEKGAEQASYSLRNLQSAQMLSIAATGKDPQTGKLRTEEYKVKGPVSIFLTTTSPEALDYETRNRFVQVGIDESQEQTRKILKAQREGDTLDGVLGREISRVIRDKHHALQRLLRPLHVVNPFATMLTYPDHVLQMRREQRKYLTLIRVCALLHQHQREVKRARRGEVEIEYIEVEPRDIELANRLAREVLGHSLSELAPHTRELLGRLVEMKRGGLSRFTRQDLLEATGWRYSQVRTHLSHLVSLEYVVVTRGGNGQRMEHELLFEGDPEEDSRHLAGLVDPATLSRAELRSDKSEPGGRD